jgi:predicted transcriptional regulator
MDNEKVSNVTLEEVLKKNAINWSLRFEVAKNAANIGGLTLYGKKFGNHAQDILVRTFYENPTKRTVERY